jgi:hypothetical protein
MANFFRPNRKMIDASRRVSKMARASEKAGIVYCSSKKCGWGWDVSESEKCPQCGAFPEQGSLKEAKKQLKKTIRPDTLNKLLRG